MVFHHPLRTRQYIGPVTTHAQVDSPPSRSEPVDAEVVEVEPVDPVARLEALLPLLEGASGADLRPGGRTPTGPVDASIAVSETEPAESDDVLDALSSVRTEMAERDEELRAVLGRLGELYQGIAEAVGPRDRARLEPPAPPALEDGSLRALLRSVDSLATVTEASLDRMADITRSVQRLAEAMHGVAGRVDRLVSRADEAEVRLERVSHLAEGVSEQVGMIGRHLGSNASRPRPPLRAVGVDDATP